jgi:hypothetical protein
MACISVILLPMVDATKRAKRGPASPYSPRVRKHLLELVAEGLSLSEAADKLGLPRRTVRSWMERDPEFEHQYEVARIERVDSLFEQYIARALAATEVVATAETRGLNPQAAATALRVELDAMKWSLSKLLPERFGDKTAVEMTGKDGAPLHPPPEAVDPRLLALALHSIVAASKGERQLPGLREIRDGSDAAPSGGRHGTVRPTPFLPLRRPQSRQSRNRNRS